MSQQVTFEIRPNGPTSVDITLTGYGAAGQIFTRTLPVFTPAQIDTFRTGDSKPKDLQDLQKIVSDWLLGADITPLIPTWLAQLNGERLRLVFWVDSRVQNTLNDLPFELVRTNPADDPVVMNPQIENFVYHLSKAATPASTATADWPMCILIVRANPGDLGGAVPLAMPIRDRILQLGNTHFAPGMVQVDLLSSEPGALGPPTWDKFRDTARSEYDVLVYLGHGDLQTIHRDLPPVAQLQFESSNPAVSDPISSKKLATFLADNPIPAVVLAGCLTAAAPAAAVPANLATWMRGNQGMAQALVDSSSGVLFAVGMRCKVESSDADKFIGQFFENLFTQDKGNLERAVRAGRRELFGDKPYSSCWAAPVVFSTLPGEPVFEYLTRPVRNFQMTTGINREIDLRREFLSLLADVPPAQRPPALVKAVEGNRQALEMEVLKQGAFILPEVADATPGTTIVIQVTFKGPFSCSYLRIKLTAGPGLTIEVPRATQLLSDAGYRLLADAAEPGVFEIQRKDGAGESFALPNGTIVEVKVRVAVEATKVCPVNLECLASDSDQPLWPGNGAVIATSGV